MANIKKYILDLGNKMYYLYIIIYLRTISGIVTFAAFTAVVTKIRVFLGKTKTIFEKVVKYSPAYLATYEKVLNYQEANYF